MVIIRGSSIQLFDPRLSTTVLFTGCIHRSHRIMASAVCLVPLIHGISVVVLTQRGFFPLSSLKGVIGPFKKLLGRESQIAENTRGWPNQQMTLVCYFFW